MLLFSYFLFSFPLPPIQQPPLCVKDSQSHGIIQVICKIWSGLHIIWSPLFSRRDCTELLPEGLPQWPARFQGRGHASRPLGAVSFVVHFAERFSSDEQFASCFFCMLPFNFSKTYCTTRPIVHFFFKVLRRHDNAIMIFYAAIQDREGDLYILS